MAKRRYGRKKTKRTKKASHRKSQKRVAAGRKAWRTKVRRYGSKAAAVAATFGHKRGRKGGHKKKRGRKGGHGRHRGGGGGRSAIFRAALAEIKKRNGTEGWPATEQEIRQAEQVAHFEAEAPRGYTPGMSAEEARQRAFLDRIEREKRAEAARRVAYKYAQREAEARRRAEEEARREVEAEARAL